jgi:hypothetical protein
VSADDVVFYDENELAAGAHARILVTGAPKAGKTTAVLTTAPGPICVLNCDGPGAAMAAKRHGAKGLRILDVTSPTKWKKGVAAACAQAEAGEVKSIVVDTVTVLVNQVLTLDYNTRFSGFEIWRNVLDAGMRGLMKLLSAPAHVFILSHYSVDDGLITLAGSLKQDVPALVHDRIHLEFDPKATPPRFFHVGSGPLTGGRSGRSEHRTIPADVKLLLTELGYTTT